MATTLVWLLATPDCRRSRPELKPRPGAQELYDQGLSLLNAGKYRKAIAIFERIALEYATTRYAADAQFFLAESYYKARDYAAAANEYDYLVTNYPTSPFYEEACYKQALCTFLKAPRVALDQSALDQARDLIALFRERFPDSRFAPGIDSLEAHIATRLAQKEFQTGLLYARAGEYGAGLIYFRHVLDNYPKATIVPQTKFWLAICLENTDERDKARALLQELAGGDFDPQLKRQAVEHLAKLK